MRKLASLAILVGLVALTGCFGQTTGANHVLPTSGELHWEGHCDTNDAGKILVRVREKAGPGAWEERDPSLPVLPDGADAGTDPDPCTARTPDSGESPGFYPWRGLRPGVTYEYSVGFDYNGPNNTAWADTDGSTNPEDYDEFTTPLFHPGIVTTSDHQKSCRVADMNEAEHVRMEFNITAAASTLDADVGYCADRGVRVLLLANYDQASLPTTTQAANLGTWADRFGPGGTFWSTREDGHLHVQQIEYGNEDSYSHRANCSPYPACLSTRAQTYAHGAVAAANAIAPVNVDLLIQADHGGSGTDVWMDNLDAAEPTLGSLADGYVIHPYGPNWADKFDKAISQASDNGWPAHPIDVTEWGLATDQVAGVGQTMFNSGVANNFGWDTNPTYAEAAAILTTEVAEMRAAYPTRLRDFMIFSAHDNAASGAKNCGGQSCREQFMGTVKSDETDKADFTWAVQDILDEPF
jgi:hypothetical protein